MKKGVIIFGVLITLLLITALPGQAQRYWRQGMWPNTGMNLTSDQITKIRELTLKFQEEIMPMETELDNLDMQLDSMSYGSMDQTKFNAINKKIDALEIELEKKYMAHENQIRALLTEEQKVLFDQWGGMGLGLGIMGGMYPTMGYGRGYAGYGRGFGRGFGSGFAGYGRGFDRGYTGYGRGYAGYGRGFDRAWNRGFGRGWGRGTGRVWGRRPGMGRGYWCPWYQQRRPYRPRIWRRN